MQHNDIGSPQTHLLIGNEVRVKFFTQGKKTCGVALVIAIERRGAIDKSPQASPTGVGNVS